jgi:long-chain acyl-CoA synthetase
MNIFDYFFNTSQNLEKDFVLGSKDTISFKQLHENSLKLASFIKENVGENQNIILISPNSVFFITAYLGILKSGNVCVPLNYAIEQDNLDFIVNITNCNTVFINKGLNPRMKFNKNIKLFSEFELAKVISEQKIGFF